MRSKITKTTVDALRPGGIMADTEVKGFVARRLPSGVVTYGLRYRVAGKQRWLALGVHGRINEVRALWAALDIAVVPAPFPTLVRLLLLTAQRRDEVAGMRWEEIDGSNWIIPAERRKKGAANTVPLPALVRQLLGRPEKGGFVFSTTGGRRAFSGFLKAKRALDEAMTEKTSSMGSAPVKPWVLHDLRRTARSLMSRAGVQSGGRAADLGRALRTHRGRRI